MEEKIETKNTPVEVNEEVKPEVEIHYKELSPIRMVVRRFFRSKLSLVGVIMLAVLFTFAFAGPPIMYAFGYEWQETETDLTPTVKRATSTLDIKTTDKDGNEFGVVQFIEEEVGINSYASMSSSVPRR